ncbi:hypothetical protein XELAEV_18004539mg [Xenopus laevis]|uniref:P2X purinoreceptor 7 intracellular domain-containing protein n=1 Tax=Xenopus laevis TaxID=8355 RepID=A0A974GZT4_XENLA|nr:hypothetical protein XELAEV_18004539mg [Xenopus laevis]
MDRRPVTISEEERMQGSRQSLIQELQSNFPDNPQRSISSANNTEQILPDPHLGNNSCCTCGHCIVIMPTSEECVCCEEIPNVLLQITEHSTCITSIQLFHTMCLDKRISDIHYIMITNQPIREDTSLHHRNLRRTANKRFTSWIHGFLGIGVCIAIPSGAVAAVCKAYPDLEANL